MIRLLIFLSGMYLAKAENRTKTLEVAKKAGVELAKLAKKGFDIAINKIAIKEETEIIEDTSMTETE